MTRIELADSLDELTSNDILDSRDLEQLIDRLESELPDPDGENEEAEPDPDKLDLLKALRELRDECSSEWRHGIGFIRESYFEDYARELADDIGAIDKNATWPCNCIDWEEAASQLKQDYTVAEIGDETYYYRD